MAARLADQLVSRLRLARKPLAVQLDREPVAVHVAHPPSADQPVAHHEVGDAVRVLVHDQPLDLAQPPAVPAEHLLADAQAPHRLTSALAAPSGRTSMRLRASSRRRSQTSR